MLPLYVFPVGGRGDFLSSIIHGNILSDDWDKETIGSPLHANATRKPLKIHNFGGNLHWDIGKFTIGPADIKRFFSIRISAADREELFQIAYLSSVKRNNNKPLTDELLKARFFMSAQQEQEFAEYRSWFRYNILFGQLFDIDFLQDLYKEITDKTYTDEELFRINHNIVLNQNLLKTNPYMLTLDNNVILKN